MLQNSGFCNFFANYRFDHFTGKIAHTSKVCKILLKKFKFFRENLWLYFREISSKFRVSRNFENAVSQPPYDYDYDYDYDDYDDYDYDDYDYDDYEYDDYDFDYDYDDYDYDDYDNDNDNDNDNDYD